MSDPKPMDPERLLQLRAAIEALPFDDGRPMYSLGTMAELLGDRDHREAEATVLRVEVLAREQDIIAQDAEAKRRVPHYISTEGYEPLTEAEIRAGAEQAWATTYVGPDPDATHDARITLGGETVLVRVKVGDKFCLQSLMHKDAAALAGWLGPARWVATAAEPVTRKAEPLARPSRIEGGTLHGPFPTDEPGRYEFTLVRDDGTYSVEDLDRVSIKNLEGEELKDELKLLELAKTDLPSPVAGPAREDVPGRYELTLDRESSEYLRTYADRVNAPPSDEES